MSVSTFSIKGYSDLLSDMMAWITSHSPQLTDLSPGAIMRSFAEATSTALEEVYVACYIGFKQKLAVLKTDVLGLKQKTGTVATTLVQFSRPLAGVTDTPIAAGTRIKTTAGLVFATTASTTILAGNLTSSPVEAASVDVGYIYNVLVGTIILLDSSVDGVTGVTNTTAATGGVDVETDSQFETRTQQFIEGLAGANLAGLKGAALSIIAITSASIVEHFPPVSNVNAHLYVDDGSAGGISGALVTQVQALIDGDGSPENPGYRAGGVNVVAIAPALVTVNITLTVYKTAANVSQPFLQATITSLISEYINGLGIGQSVIFMQLGSLCLNVPGVKDVVVTAPAANVTISSVQAARVGTFSFTFL